MTKEANTFLRNTTNIPDAVAPYIPNVEAVSGPVVAADTRIPIRAHVYDNAPYYTTLQNATSVDVSVDGCHVQTVKARSSAGQVFRAALPLQKIFRQDLERIALAIRIGDRSSPHASDRPVPGLLLRDRNKVVADEYAIVMGIEMDWPGINRSPDLEASAATAHAYSKMAQLAGSLAKYIRVLGYEAIPCGNDTAQSIPLAIDAGLASIYRSNAMNQSVKWQG